MRITVDRDLFGNPTGEFTISGLTSGDLRLFGSMALKSQTHFSGYSAGMVNRVSALLHDAAEARRDTLGHDYISGLSDADMMFRHSLTCEACRILHGNHTASPEPPNLAFRAEGGGGEGAPA